MQGATETGLPIRFGLSLKLRHQPHLNICLSYPVNNAPFAEIIGRHLKPYAITQVKADEAFPHLT
jgi:hypothetical protein